MSIKGLLIFTAMVLISLACVVYGLKWESIVWIIFGSLALFGVVFAGVGFLIRGRDGLVAGFIAGLFVTFLSGALFILARQ